MEAFQEIDRSLDTFNGANWIVPGVGFFGGPLLIVVAIALDRSRPMLWWLLAALVLILATIAITFGFHVPLNDALKAAGNPDGIDVAQVRDDFRESWWRGWNVVRCVTATAAAACLMWALVLHARAATETRQPGSL